MRTRAHGKHEGRRRWIAPVAGAGSAVLIVAAGAAAIVLVHHAASSAAPRPSAPHTPPVAHGQTTTERTTSYSPPLLVTSISPAAGASGVTYQPTITITLSAPLASDSPLPTISPQLTGWWTEPTPKTLVFRATDEISPYTTESITLPGGTGGMRDSTGSVLAATKQSSFTVEGASELRLQQLLAELGYLPLNFVRSVAGSTGESGTGGSSNAGTTSPESSPAGSPSSGKGTAAEKGASVPPSEAGGTTAHDSHSKAAGSVASVPPAPAIDSEATAADEVSLAPEPGSFVWRWTDIPSTLSSLWEPGQYNVITRGAVMAFESAENLTTDGDAGAMVWRALLQAVASRQLDSAPYNYLWVSQQEPETLYIWQNGAVVMSVLANTGVSVAPTAPGTYPVYARYLVTTMSGKNPDGVEYHDPGIPYVSYFNGGDAVHGYIRSAYGFPQSLGCVEVSYYDAKLVFPYDPLGTLVTVDPPPA